MNKEKAWVWFKGGLKGGCWMSGFFANKGEQEILNIESPNFIACKLPLWRVRFSEPEDTHIGPVIPEDAIWKYN